MKPLLEICHVHKQYPSFALQDVSLCVPEGTVMGLIGENGAGKTTLLRLVLGLGKPDSGSVRIFGKSPEELTKAEREQIGVVFDEGCIPGSMTAEDAKGVLSLLYRSFRKEVFEAFLHRFRLPERQKIGTYSKGMQMKLSLAVALSHDARLFLFDEPTAGLDPVMREEILDEFFSVIQDGTRSILFSSHITSDLDKVCDYVTGLQGGRILFSEEKDVLKSRYVLVHESEQTLSRLPAGSVAGIRRHRFGTEALVKADAVPSGWVRDSVGMEEIFLFLSGEKDRKEETI